MQADALTRHSPSFPLTSTALRPLMAEKVVSGTAAGALLGRAGQLGHAARVSRSSPTRGSVTENRPCCPRSKDQLCPEGQDGRGAAALVCLLSILTGLQVGNNFKKTCHAFLVVQWLLIRLAKHGTPV